MKLAVVTNVEHDLSELISYGTSVGFDMVAINSGFFHEITSSVHAVIDIMKGTLADTREELSMLAHNMQSNGIKRLVIYSHDLKDIRLHNENFDWTVISDANNSRQKSIYDKEFAKYLIGQVTDSRNINSIIVRPTSG